MKNTYATILLCFLCFWGYAKTYIPTITFSEKVYKQIPITYTDFFKDTYHFQLGKDNPTVSVETEIPLWFHVKGDVYMLFPGEGMEFNMDSATISQSSFDIVQRRNDLNFLKALKAYEGRSISRMFVPVTHKKAKKVIKILVKQKDSVLTFLEAYHAATPMTDTFLIISRQTVEASYGLTLLKIAAKHKMHVEDLDNDSKALINQCLQYDIHNPTVEELVTSYLSLQRSGRDSSYTNHEREMAIQTLPESTYEYIAFTSIKNKYISDTRISGGSFSETDISNNTYRIYLDKLKKFQPDNHTEKLLFTNNGKKYRFSEALEDKEDKYYYIYFWNSGSIASVKGLKKHLELMKKHPSSPVKFVFISLDENPIVWNELCKKMDITQLPYNYIIAYNYNSPLAQDFKVNTVPRSVVLDNQGYVISFHAPDPSEENLKYLEQKFNKYYGQK